MQGTPYTFVDGIIEKVGAYSGGSNCVGDSSGCTYQYFMGTDSQSCSLRNNQGIEDRQPIASPLAIGIVSDYDAGSLSGTMTVTVTLDADVVPAAGTINYLTVILYERGVTSSYGKDQIFYPQVARTTLLTEQVTVTLAGEAQTFTGNFLLDPSWVPANMGALAFVQNYGGSASTAPYKLQPKEIYNSGFLGDIITPPVSRHLRPVTKP